MTDAAETPKPPLALPPGVDRLADLGTLLTLREAADRLEVSVKTVRRMITRGDIVGAYQVPMASGKGTQWVMPYSEIVKAENTAQAKPSAVAASELTVLREQVAKLSQALAVQEALATDRAHQLEALHTSMRMLSAAQNATPSRWWRRGH